MLQNLLKLDLCEIIDLKSHDLNIWSIYRLSSVKFQNFDLEAFSGKKHNKGDSEFFSMNLKMHTNSAFSALITSGLPIIGPKKILALAPYQKGAMIIGNILILIR